MAEYLPPDRDDFWSRELLLQILKRLDPFDRALVRFHYLAGETQVNIARLVGISQPSVSERLQKARCKIKYYIDLPDVFPEDRPRREGWTEEEWEILATLLSTGSLVSASVKVGRTAYLVRLWLRRRLGRFSLPMQEFIEYILENEPQHLQPRRSYRRVAICTEA